MFLFLFSVFSDTMNANFQYISEPENGNFIINGSKNKYTGIYGSICSENMGNMGESTKIWEEIWEIWEIREIWEEWGPCINEVKNWANWKSLRALFRQ